MSKKLVLTATSAVALLALAACSSSDTGSSSSSSSAPSESTPSSSESGSSSGGSEFAAGIKVGYASPVAAQEGQQSFDVGAQEAADSVGWEYTMYDSNLSPDTQISNITTMIQKGMNVVGSWTLDPGATAGIYTQADEAGIPIVGANSEGTGVKASIWYETQLCTAGGPAEKTAALFATKYPGGSVITIGLDGVPSIDNSVKCFTDAAEAAGLKVISHVSNNTDDAAGGQKLIADLVTKYPDVNAVWAYNDASALGASAALMSAGKTISDGTSDGVLVVGTNGDSDAIKAVQEGRLTGTWDPNNVDFGWLFIMVANQALAGDAPASTVLKSTFIDKTSVVDYVPPADRDVSFDTLDYTTS